MRLNREFYRQNAVDAAKGLVGKLLVHKLPEGTVSGIITETEAYMGPDDAAAHSYRHKGRNGRTAVLYQDGGYAYVFLIYGVYHCFNIGVNRPGTPECVLIRSLEPVSGLDVINRRRNGVAVERWCDGPGKLCLAFGIDKSHNGADICGGTLYVEDTAMTGFSVEASRRINIDYAGQHRDLPYRFTLCYH